ncbi:transcriptional regulator, CdaR [Candidatus Protofrankia datiscae]|uniref:Transcriptional regulator, CdaR n=2 Tax=Frankiaceae TaxID=74712 RepID=F8B0M1_9ACTN|nr:transcriptional regulator, CdaR [Candidatus Protofrankia datiscae]
MNGARQAESEHRQIPNVTGMRQPSECASEVGGEHREHRELAAFRKLAGALAEERDLDTIFHLIVDTLSELTGADRCSLHLRDRETGLLHGKAAHAARDIDIPVKQLVSGMPGDNFTREILDTGRPVMLTNTLVDPRPVHAAMRRWRARSVLGIPMRLRGEVIGILCLDTEDTTMEFSQSDQELALSFAELAATAINQVQLTSQLRDSLHVQARQLEMLQRARRMEGQLADIALSGWGVRELGETVAQLLSKPCAIYDVDFRCLSCAGAADDLRVKLRSLGNMRHHPSVEPVMESLESGRPQCIPPLPQAGINHRLLLTSIELNGQRQGYVVVVEAAGRFGQLDEVIVRRAAHNIALERLRSRFDQDMEWHAVEALVGSLIRGERGLGERARSLGVDLTARRVVCLVAARDSSSANRVVSRQVAQILTDRESPSSALAAWSGSDIAVIIEVPKDHDRREAIEWVRVRLCTVLAELSPEGQLCAAISTVVEAPGDDQRAHREAQQVLKCIREHLSDAEPGVLAADDLGAARLLLASTSRDEARQLVLDTFGPLLRDRSVKSVELMSTLEPFLRLARNVRDCADELGVHPNTVRYRLTNIERLTGLRVTTDDSDYLTAQMAMAIVRLGGCPAVAAGVGYPPEASPTSRGRSMPSSASTPAVSSSPG